MNNFVTFKLVGQFLNDPSHFYFEYSNKMFVCFFHFCTSNAPSKNKNLDLKIVI